MKISYAIFLPFFVQIFAILRARLQYYLSKYQKKILLRIIDDKDLISEAKSVNRFIDGLKIGLMIGMEIHCKQEIIPQDE